MRRPSEHPGSFSRQVVFTERSTQRIQIAFLDPLPTEQNTQQSKKRSVKFRTHFVRTKKVKVDSTRWHQSQGKMMKRTRNIDTGTNLHFAYSIA